MPQVIRKSQKHFIQWADAGTDNWEDLQTECKDLAEAEYYMGRFVGSDRRFFGKQARIIIRVWTTTDDVVVGPQVGQATSHAVDING